MAKRPPRSKTEEDVIGATEAVGPEEHPDVNSAEESLAVDQVDQVPPVAMEEPPRFEPDPAAPDAGKNRAEDTDAAIPGVVSIEADPVDTKTVGANPETDTLVPRQTVEKRGGGFVSTALGGVVAAAAGYALATFVPFPGIGTSDAPPTATQAEVQALAARIESLESAPDQGADLADRIAALEVRPVPEATPNADISPLTESLATLESRVVAIETRGPGQPGETSSAELIALVDSLRTDVAEMQATGADANAGIEALAAQTEARLAEAEAQAAALRAEAEQTARRAVTAAALGRVQAALESGAPFAGALADLPDVEIPETLAGFAQTGVPSRAALQDSFPPAARAALEASLRANLGEGWSDRVASFLQATTGARSLVPREGSDPDAVLSRAEAAVRSGDIAQALTELESLPPEGQAEMAEWQAMAQQRLDAIAAASALSAAVEG